MDTAAYLTWLEQDLPAVLESMDGRDKASVISGLRAIALDALLLAERLESED